jgi:hypothetical protein
MRVQRIWKYRCEVVSVGDPDYGCLDWLYSREQLRDGHCYEATLNNSSANPMIVAVIRELQTPDEP